MLRTTTLTVLLLALLTTALAQAADRGKQKSKKNVVDPKIEQQFQAWKAGLPEDHRAWVTVLEANLGSFYLPRYKRVAVAEKPTVWDYVADDPKLPRVLLIGDSISGGYTLPTRRALAGKANLHRAPENCGSTVRGLDKLDIWLGKGNWDVIHFNFGIHDRNSKPDEYGRRLQQIVDRLKKTGAKLIWASSTPMPPGSKKLKDASIVKLNAVAADIMRRNDIPINDLYGAIKPTLAEHQLPNDNCHFNRQGSERLSQEVSKAILQALK